MKPPDFLKEAYDQWMARACSMFATLSLLQKDFKHWSVRTEKPYTLVPDPDDSEVCKPVFRDELVVTIRGSNEESFSQSEPPSCDPRTKPLEWIKYLYFAHPEAHAWVEHLIADRVKKALDRVEVKRG